MARLRRCRDKPPRADRRGAQVVELAIVLPILLLLLAGIIEFGQAFRIQHALSNGARRGVRAAVVSGRTNDQIVEIVRTQCSRTMNVAASDVAVDVAVNGVPNAALASAESGDEIRVGVSVPYAKAGVGFYANLFSNSALRSECSLEHE